MVILLSTGFLFLNIYSFFKKEEISLGMFVWIFSLLLVPASILIILAYINSKRYREKNEIFSFSLVLLVYFAGFFGIMKYITAEPPKTPIPFLREGTIGFRAWGCKAKIGDIRITYISKKGIPKQVAINLLGKDNFLKAWTEMTSDDNYDDCAKNRWLNLNRDKGERKQLCEIAKEIFKPDYEWIIEEKRIEEGFVSVKRPAFRVKNCGVYFKEDKELLEDVEKYIKIEASVILEESDKDVIDKINSREKTNFGKPFFGANGIQFCLAVPRVDDILHRKRDYSQDDHSPYIFSQTMEVVHASDIYLGLELAPLKIEDSKVWIPDLNLQPGATFREPTNRRRKHGFADNLTPGVKYKLIAFEYGGTVRLQGKDTDGFPVILYEGRIEEPRLDSWDDMSIKMNELLAEMKEFKKERGKNRPGKKSGGMASLKW